MSSELESPTDESRQRGLLGHTTIRVDGAIVLAALDQTLMHAGWGTGVTVSYGVARAAQVSLGLAYYQFRAIQFAYLDCDCSVSPSRNEIRQTTMSVELQPPTMGRVRPWFGAGFGVYERTETRDETTYSYPGQYTYRSVTSGTKLGMNWGVGISARLGQRLAIDFAGRYHHSFGRPFLTSDPYMDGARLLTAQAGLSYVVR